MMAIYLQFDSQKQVATIQRMTMGNSYRVKIVIVYALPPDKSGGYLQGTLTELPL